MLGHQTCGGTSKGYRQGHQWGQASRMSAGVAFVNGEMNGCWDEKSESERAAGRSSVSVRPVHVGAPVPWPQEGSSLR